MPKPLPPSTKRRRITEAAYRSLLGVLKSGRPVMDPRTGEQRIGDDGKPVFTPATAADVAQARQMARELERESETSISNPYAEAGAQRLNLRAALIGLGYSDREAAAIINRKRATSEHDHPD